MTTSYLAYRYVTAPRPGLWAVANGRDGGVTLLSHLTMCLFVPGQAYAPQEAHEQVRVPHRLRPVRKRGQLRREATV